MKKIINEIKSTIYCKYIHITKKVNNDKFKCTCECCKYFKKCDKSYYIYLLNELDRLNMLFFEKFFDDYENPDLLDISYQANIIERFLKYYDESEE